MPSELPGVETSELPARDSWLLQQLLGSGQLSDDDSEHIRKLWQARKGPLPRLLMQLGVVPEKALTEALAEFHDTLLIEQTDLPDKAVSGHDFSARFLRGAEVLPLWKRDGEIFVAMAEPADSGTADSIRMMCEMPVRVCTAARSVILDGIERLYGAADPGGARIRYRIDGVLHDVETLDPETALQAWARIKLISNLDVAERRLPQDGRFKLDVDGHAIDIRVSTIPVNKGESIVLRILHRSHTRIQLGELGFSNTVTDAIDTCLKRSSGLFLPAGCDRILTSSWSARSVMPKSPRSVSRLR